MKYYRTSEIAKAVHVHPNTVRLYEEWGLMMPVPRDENGYRRYSQAHLEQMRLARYALRCEFAAGKIREKATAIVRTAARGDLDQAKHLARAYLQHVHQEQQQAREVLEVAKEWIRGNWQEEEILCLKRQQAADLIGVSIDVLRGWERNALIDIPRDSQNNYRYYGSREIKRLKLIRLLRTANYSYMAIHRMMRQIDSGMGVEAIDYINKPSAEEDIITATDHWIQTLQETEDDAKLVIQQLERMGSCL
ncbi:MAG: MerR family transcriptional regulator [Tindallia sp. MSAO_Bac2]|nr:MAG: MerR family transcriptional regulator [Tindallia sp. MSAO_Bac2]